MAFHSFGNNATRLDSNSTVTPPSRCPACRSVTITTTAKSPNVNTYWRCENCGEIWNASRREDRDARVARWR